MRTQTQTNVNVCKLTQTLAHGRNMYTHERDLDVYAHTKTHANVNCVLSVGDFLRGGYLAPYVSSADLAILVLALLWNMFCAAASLSHSLSPSDMRLTKEL